jgi:hyperosmotically inducible protein
MTIYYQMRLGGNPLNRFAISLVLSSALLTFSSGAIAQNSAPAAPDNSAVNVRDRNTGALTADQQSNVKSDEELSRKIRRAILKEDSLSMMAHNVKIISVDGTVTLRGPVKTEAEKTTVAHLAREIAGRHNVDNQLEVKGQE